MIKGIAGLGSIVTTGGNTSVPYINQNNNNPMQGMLRVSGTDIQVFDGGGWITMNSSYASVALEATAQEAIRWATRKMNEEAELKARMEQHPGLKQSYEQFQIMDILTKEQDAGQRV